MSRGRLALAGGAVAITAGTLGAFAAVGIGGGDGTGYSHQNAGPAAIEVDVAATRAASAAEPARAGRRGVRITHFITRNSIAVPSGVSVFTPLRCPRGKGQPLSGGIFTNGVPEVDPSVISRFNPNTGRAPRNRFFVGASNESGVAGSFFATFTCIR